VTPQRAGIECAWCGSTTGDDGYDLCRRRDMCHVAYGYRRLYEETRTAPARLLTCAECQQPFEKAQPAEPMITLGHSGTLLIVTHLIPCVRRPDR